MAAKTLSVYIKDDALFEQAKQAHADSKININEVCSEALQRALHPPVADPQPEIDQETVRAAQQLDAAQTFLNESEQIEYDISYSNSQVEASAFLAHVTSNGAWPISLSIDQAGRYCFLIGYPKVLAELPS